MRIDGTFREFGTCLNDITIIDLYMNAIMDGIHFALIGIILVGNDDLALLLVLGKRHAAADLSQCCVMLGLAGLKQFLNAGKTLRDISSTCDTACMECTHGQLCTGFADSLSGNDTNSFADIHVTAVSQVHTIAAGAYTIAALTGQYRTHLYALDTGLTDCISFLIINGLVQAADNFTRLGINDIFSSDTAQSTLSQRLHFADSFQLDSAHAFIVLLKAVGLTDNDFLCDIHQAAGQVTRVSSTKCCIRQSFTGTMGGHEELQNVQAFQEVCTNRDLDRLAAGRSHVAAHTGQLCYLCDRTAGTGVGHHVDGVLLRQYLQHASTKSSRCVIPGIDDVAVALVISHKAAAELLFNVTYAIVRSFQHISLFRRDDDIADCNSDSSAGGILVTHGLDVIKHTCTDIHAMYAEAALNDITQILLDDDLVNLQLEHIVHAVTGLEAQILWNILIEDQFAQSRLDQTAFGHALKGTIDTYFDGALQGNLMCLIGHQCLVLVRKYASCTNRFRINNGQVVAANNHVLSRTDNRLAILRLHNVVRAQHQEAGFCLGFHGKRNVNSHLVAVEVRVISGTGERMQFHGFTFNKHGLKSLNAQTVKSRCAVEQYRMILNNSFQDIPDFRFDFFNHTLGSADIMCNALLDQLLHYKGLEQLQRHLLRKTALMQFEFRTYNNNGTAGIVNTLAQQILAETSLFTTE